MTDYPYEDWEQTELVLFLRNNNIPHFRVPNETYTKGYKQKKKNYDLGVSPGVMDIFFVVGRLYSIEMKRVREAKPSTSKDQKKWLKILNDAGVPSVVCYGHDEAIDRVIDCAAENGIYLEHPNDSIF